MERRWIPGSSLKRERHLITEFLPLMPFLFALYFQTCNWTPAAQATKCHVVQNLIHLHEMIRGVHANQAVLNLGLKPLVLVQHQ